MSDGFKEVSRREPCPICGGPDWCCLDLTKGYPMYVCKRQKGETNIMGCDGNFYIFDSVSKNGNLLFEEANQRYARLQQEEDISQVIQCQRKPKPKEKNRVQPLSNKELDRIYRALLDELVLDPHDAAYLKREGWGEELLKKNYIVSFPEPDFIRFRYKHFFSKNPYRKKLANLIMSKLGLSTLEGVPGAFKNKQGEWTFSGPSGILFPLYDADGNIYRLRIRMNFLDVNAEYSSTTINERCNYCLEGKQYYIYPHKGIYQYNPQGSDVRISKGKYRNFSSYHAEVKCENGEEVIANTYNSGCESGNQLGVYYNYSRDNMYTCFITEGEKKGIFANERMHVPFISMPGVDSFSKLIEGKVGERIIDKLKNKGVTMFIIAFDADKFMNEAVMAAQERVVHILRKEGFLVGVANWNILDGKGIDDLLLNNHLPNYELA